MIVSRIALLLALAALGSLMTCGYRSPGYGYQLAGSPDIAQLASQLSTRPASPARADAERTSRAPASHEPELRLIAFDAPQATAIIRPDEQDPFQLISPEIKAKAELIPGRWKARHRFTTEVFGEEARETDPWISELRTPQLELQAVPSVVPRREDNSKRNRSERR